MRLFLIALGILSTLTFAISIGCLFTLWILDKGVVYGYAIMALISPGLLLMSWIYYAIGMGHSENFNSYV